MSSLIRAVVALVSIALLGGCGDRVVLESMLGFLRLGNTTVSEARQFLGRPDSERGSGANQLATMPRNWAEIPDVDTMVRFRPTSESGLMTLLVYQQLSNAGGRPFRELILHFWNGRLVQYTYGRSGPSARQRPEPQDLETIVKGQTTEADLIARFGQPGGQAIYPRISSRDQRMLVFYSDLPAGSTAEPVNSLYVLVDGRNVVVGFTLTRHSVRRG